MLGLGSFGEGRRSSYFVYVKGCLLFVLVGFESLEVFVRSGGFLGVGRVDFGYGYECVGRKSSCRRVYLFFVSFRLWGAGGVVVFYFIVVWMIFFRESGVVMGGIVDISDVSYFIGNSFGRFMFVLMGY